MFSCVEFFIMAFDSDSNSEDEQESEDEHDSLRYRNRELRNSSNILEMPEQEFINNFRMNKECFIRLLDEITPLIKPDKRTTAIPPILKLASFLRFLAGGSYQSSVGNQNFAAMSQSRVSRNITEFLNIFEKYICPKYICLVMTQEEECRMKEQFFVKYGIPGVVGCVDGAHIRIQTPRNEVRHLYHNRNSFYSMNAMMICDFSMVIRFVDARYPGENDDSFIWKMSAADEYFRRKYNSGKRNTWLLGDSAYLLQPYLMTPYRDPQQPHEVEFNRKLSIAHNVIEQCFGMLKNRFRCLIAEKGLYYSPEMAIKIINACCATHNFCFYNKSPWQFEGDAGGALPDVIEEEVPARSAISIRNELAMSILDGF